MSLSLHGVEKQLLPKKEAESRAINTILINAGTLKPLSLGEVLFYMVMNEGTVDLEHLGPIHNYSSFPFLSFFHRSIALCRQHHLIFTK